MRKTCMLLLILFLSGCAEIQHREDMDPGHGGYLYVLRTASSSVESTLSPLTWWQKLLVPSPQIGDSQ
jgi:uncharacterized protein YceK